MVALVVLALKVTVNAFIALIATSLVMDILAGMESGTVVNLGNL